MLIAKLSLATEDPVIPVISLDEALLKYRETLAYDSHMELSFVCNGLLKRQDNYLWFVRSHAEK